MAFRMTIPDEAETQLKALALQYSRQTPRQAATIATRAIIERILNRGFASLVGNIQGISGAPVMSTRRCDREFPVPPVSSWGVMMPILVTIPWRIVVGAVACVECFS